jgi:hypothetical protein
MIFAINLKKAIDMSGQTILGSSNNDFLYAQSVGSTDTL